MAPVKCNIVAILGDDSSYWLLKGVVRKKIYGRWLNKRCNGQGYILTMDKAMVSKKCLLKKIEVDRGC